ncbi:Fis family transcriptional regulator [Bradyrhizobium sp. AZCC 2289]|uniref:Fis family transcriptional regulator n=1 Tax=Bradyrhizobium sp. AZCC 2289 TaxID=3117026 RepID=UPI002FEF8174
MTKAGDWLSVFPQEDARVAVDALRKVWAELTTLSPETFHADAKEPRLTELLCEHIRSVFKTRTRLTGQWSYERRIGKIKQRKSGGVEIADRRRTDIEYFSDRYDPALELVFEFKKINGKAARRNTYVGSDGMLRFVTGSYSIKQPLAVMVGIVTDKETACVQPLIDLLKTSESMAALQMKPAPSESLKIPSFVLPKIAQFDTEHQRAAELAAEHGTITIAHLFLGFPVATA